MMHFQVPRRLSPNEYPSLPRLVQFVLCNDGWARIDAYRVSSTSEASFRLLIWLPCVNPHRVHFKLAYEHVYGIRLDEYEAEEHIRRKIAIQQRTRSFPVRYAYYLNPAHNHPVTNDQSGKHPRSRRSIQLRSQ